MVTDLTRKALKKSISQVEWPVTNALGTETNHLFPGKVGLPNAEGREGSTFCSCDIQADFVGTLKSAVPRFEAN